ncbi:hypothetical protein GCM10023193_09420 [Planotetraspora kaengkrachanensis]
MATRQPYNIGSISRSSLRWFAGEKSYAWHTQSKTNMSPIIGGLPFVLRRIASRDGLLFQRRSPDIGASNSDSARPD